MHYIRTVVLISRKDVFLPLNRCLLRWTLIRFAEYQGVFSCMEKHFSLIHAPKLDILKLHITKFKWNLLRYSQYDLNGMLAWKFDMKYILPTLLTPPTKCCFLVYVDKILKSQSSNRWEIIFMYFLKNNDHVFVGPTYTLLVVTLTLNWYLFLFLISGLKPWLVLISVIQCDSKMQ